MGRRATAWRGEILAWTCDQDIFCVIGEWPLRSRGDSSSIASAIRWSEVLLLLLSSPVLHRELRDQLVGALGESYYSRTVGQLSLHLRRLHPLPRSPHRAFSRARILIIFSWRAIPGGQSGIVTHEYSDGMVAVGCV